MTVPEIVILIVSSLSLVTAAFAAILFFRYGKKESGAANGKMGLTEEEKRQIIDGVGLKNEALGSELKVRVENMDKENRELSDTLLAMQKEEKEALSILIKKNGAELNEGMDVFSEATKALLAEFITSFEKTNQKERSESQEASDRFHKELGEKVNILLLSMEKNISSILVGQDNLTKARLESMEKTMEERLVRMEKTNKEKLDAIQGTVEEKLENTLSLHLKQSFDTLLGELNRVTEAVGEIKSMSKEVGSLRNALTNVKMRGIVGEVVLGNLISDVLTPDQYVTNAVIREGSRDSVEYAIRLPGKENGTVLLPVDSKFPLEDYRAIKEAVEEGSKDQVAQARKSLRNKVKAFAKDIHDKYIEVPKTTDFGIMFLPTESLYGEIADLGLVEEIQREYQVVMVSPSTFQALLNALQMGFRSVSIEKKSAEITELLFRVKKQFDAFAETLSKTQASINKASDDLEKLVGTRTRMLKKQLDKMEEVGYFEEQEKSQTEN